MASWLTALGGLTDTPWRQVDSYTLPLFASANELHMRQDILKEFDGGFNLSRFNILLVGNVGAGKSSFVNSVASLCKNLLPYTVVPPVDAKAGLYGKFAPRRGIMKGFTLLNWNWRSQDHSLHVEDVSYLVQGNIPSSYKFNPISPISEDDPRFIKKPAIKQRIHCIAYVIDAQTLYGDVQNEQKRKFIELQTKLNKTGVIAILVLTKVDRVCSMVRQDITCLYRSVRVRDVVRRASEMFRLPENAIYPLQNYTSEEKLRFKLQIPILLALRRMLDLAEDNIDQMADTDDED